MSSASPARVPVAVVERLELVDVDEGEHEPAVAAAGAVDLVLERDLAHLAPQRAGEVVVVGVAELDARRARDPRPPRRGRRRRPHDRRPRGCGRAPLARAAPPGACASVARAGRRAGGLERLGGAIALHRRQVAGARRQVARVGGAEPLGRRARALRGRREPLVGRLAPVGASRRCTRRRSRSAPSCSRSAAA